MRLGDAVHRPTGQERDTDPALDYFSARFYQPRHGRFTTVDPVFGSVADPQQGNRRGL